MFQWAKSIARRNLPRVTVFSGSSGSVRFAGTLQRAPSIAAFFCGPDARRITVRRVPKGLLARACLHHAVQGHATILHGPGVATALAELSGRTLEVPVLVSLVLDVPEDTETLMERIRTSTTREDLRRIRKAGFNYRVETDPDALRIFYERFYIPSVTSRFPDDGRIESLEGMQQRLVEGGELVCADLAGEWVAGILNTAGDGGIYGLGQLGIRDADDGVRQKRVVAALLVESFRRAVELGYGKVSLGLSLPFLGKGPVWFKSKWGAVLQYEAKVPKMHLLMDLRHAEARRTLAECPIIHRDGTASLVATCWLPPGETAQRAALREAGRYPGLAHWNVLAEPDTLAEGAEALAAAEGIVPVPVDTATDGPVWLGEVLAGGGEAA